MKFKSYILVGLFLSGVSTPLLAQQITHPAGTPNVIEAGNTLTLSGFYNFNAIPFTVDAGAPGGTLNNNGYLTNAGPLTNNGVLNNAVWLANYTTLENGGTLANTGTLGNVGTVNNNAAGTLNNAGILLSYSALTNEGKLDNKAAGTLTNVGTLNNNAGTLTNGGILSNFNVVNNAVPATLANGGELSNFGFLDNDGVLNNTANGSLVNFGYLTNVGTLDCFDLATLTNVGVLENNGVLRFQVARKIGTVTELGNDNWGEIDLNAGGAGTVEVWINEVPAWLAGNQVVLVEGIFLGNFTNFDPAKFSFKDKTGAGPFVPSGLRPPGSWTASLVPATSGAPFTADLVITFAP